MTVRSVDLVTSPRKLTLSIRSWRVGVLGQGEGLSLVASDGSTVLRRSTAKWAHNKLSFTSWELRVQTIQDLNLSSLDASIFGLVTNMIHQVVWILPCMLIFFKREICSCYKRLDSLETTSASCLDFICLPSPVFMFEERAFCPT